MIKISLQDKSFFVNSEDYSFLRKIQRSFFSVYLSLTVDSFWKRLSKGKWEKEIFQILDKYLKADKSYIDVGAWVGPTVLYGAQIAKHCYAIEPDTAAFKILEYNVSLNSEFKDKISLYNGAISNKLGKVIISPGFSFADSTTSLYQRKNSPKMFCESVDFDGFVNKFKINDCNFVKIDTEGAESIILPTMKDFIKKYKPTIYLSIHPYLANKIGDIDKMLDTIKVFKYIYNKKGQKIPFETVRKKVQKRALFSIILTDQEN